MKKALIFFIFLFFINVLKVKAIEEITIVCEKNKKCLNSSNSPIFSEKNIYPGFSINKKIKIINQTNLPCDLNLQINKENNFDDNLAKKILMKINNKNYILNKIFKNFIYLGKIPANKFRFYDFSYTFDKQSGNEFKNKNIDFKIDFNFECENKEQIIFDNKNQKVLGMTTESTLNIGWYILLILISLTGMIILGFQHWHQKTNPSQKKNEADY